MSAVCRIARGVDWELIHGEALKTLMAFPDECAEALVADPPYCSGGLHASSRSAPPEKKYQRHGVQKTYPTFSGDTRDQRSYLAWCALWLTECARILKPGSYALVFTDWRQLPVMTDAMQAAGFTWRGTLAWDKGPRARGPHKGYFRHQCEYIAWGTKGACGVAKHGGPWPGCYRHPVNAQEKLHLTAKPLALMRELARVIPPGGLILDPFCGSATTGVAAILEGYRFVGVEKEAAYFDISVARMIETERRLGRQALLPLL